MADSASQLLQQYSDRLSKVVFSKEIVQLLHTEGIISEKTATEIERTNDCKLSGDPLMALYTAVAEDHNKLKLLADILMNTDETGSLANEILQEYSECTGN